MDNSARYPWILCLLSLLLFFPGLGLRDFWAPVEPRYAEIARVMFAKGQWVVPTVNGDLYADKPILYFWLVLIGSNFAGSVNEWTVRLPAALSALGAVLITYALGRDFFSPRAGFIAGAVLATTARALWEARWAHTDMPFTFFFATAMYLFARATFHKGHANEILGAYAFMGLATLTKGVIGVVLPALIAAAYVAARKEWRFVREWRLASGIGIFLLIAAPWFGWVYVATDGKWLEEFIYVHHFQRYTAGFGHREPFYYYLITLPRDFLPWTIFALAALPAYRPWGRIFNEPALLFFVLWFLMIFLFFSFSDTKRDLYLLPLFPATALLIGNYFDDLIEGKIEQDGLYRGLSFLLFNLLWLAAALSPLVAWRFQGEFVWIGMTFAAVVAGGAVGTVFFVWRRLPWAVFLATVVTVTLGVQSVFLWLLPAIDRYKSPQPFSRRIEQRVPATEPLYIYADRMNDFNFYTEREIIPVVTSPAELEKLLSRNQAGYLLLREKDLEQLPLTVPRSAVTDSVGSERWHLIALDHSD